MARKLFLSVLGTSDYAPCVYVSPKDNYKSGQLRFVQEAALEILKPQLSRNDEVVIFVTEGERGSYEINWLNNGHENSKWGSEGLESRLGKLNLPCSVRAVKLGADNTEEGIWAIFSTIYENIKEGDHIYFDITHAFRYLPMLVLVLLNYSKFLKNVVVEQITYGNFEGRNKESNEVPLLDITSLSMLQDWTTAASEFLNNGNAENIAQLAQSQLTPILAEAKGKDRDAVALSKFSNALNAFSNEIITGRSKKIYQGKQIKKIRDQAEKVKNNLIPAMKPLIEKTLYKIREFQPGAGIRNGFAATRWCIDNNLIQQGYSLLVETTISAVFEKMGRNNYFDKIEREVVSSAFFLYQNKIPEESWTGSCGTHPDKVEPLFRNPFFKLVAGYAAGLGEYRNDLLHAGTKKGSFEREDIFKEKLEKNMEDISRIYKEN